MATISEKLEAIALKLENMVDRPGDAWADHKDADALLREALELMMYSKSRTAVKVQRILTAYDKTPRGQATWRIQLSE